jgi:hypothetical protein
MAINYERYSYGFIKNLLENKASELWQENPQDQTTDQSLPDHGNIRGKNAFTQSKLNI